VSEVTPADQADAAGMHRVVIVGCGFGGLFAAKALRRAPVQVTVVDRTNHHLFQPLLYQVATGILSEGEIAPAIRDVLRRHRDTDVVLAEVQGIRPDTHQLDAVSLDGRSFTIDYDSLIVAGGAVTSYFGHDEYARCASGMKSLDDAMRLRGQIFGAFECAEAEDDEEQRRALMTFVVIGGGPTGVEMAGQLTELARRALRHNYRRINPRATRVILVEGGDRLLAPMGERISRLTARALTRMGVEIHTCTMVTGMDENGVELTPQDGTPYRVEAATRIWAAGTRAAPLGAALATATAATTDKGGRLRVAADCSLPGHPEIFVVGDLMSLHELPAVAEVAIQSGVHAAHVIERRLRGDARMKPFRYRDLGTLAAVGRFRAVASVGPLRVGGVVGWLLWLVVHLTFLTGFKNRFGALGRWSVSFIGRGRFERALTDPWEAHGPEPGQAA
jgi:NADH dehydrogenase